MSKQAFEVDESSWPIIGVKYPAVPSKPDVDVLVEVLDRAFERARSQRIHLATVADLRPLRLELVSGDVRKYVAVALSQIDKKFPGIAVCDAVISDSTMVRAIISSLAYLRLNRNHVTRCFKTPTEAFTWAQLTLRSTRTMPTAPSQSAVL